MMRKISRVSAAIIVTILTTTTVVARSARSTGATSAKYTPPAETGMIWTVINYRTDARRAEHTSVSVTFGDANRTIIMAPPGYGNPCAQTSPSGFVLRLRHSTPDPTPLTLSTDGTIVRGPYQGDAPPELLHVCYKLVK